MVRMRPTIAQTLTSKSVLLKNMFDPEEYVVNFTNFGDTQRYHLTQRERTCLGQRTGRRCERGMPNQIWSSPAYKGRERY